MKPYLIRHGNCTSSGGVYTDRELKRAWSEDGQGHKESLAQGELCVVTECSKKQAVAISKQFVIRFACPTSVTYDGREISLYCGHAGGGTRALIDDTVQIAERCLQGVS